MIAQILTILAGLPKVLDFIKWVHGEVSDWLVIRENKARRKAIEDGIEKAKETGDTSGIEDAFK